MLADPEKLRRAADDLSKTANEFLAASWHVAGGRARCPELPSASTRPASSLRGDHQLARILQPRVWNLTSFGVDASRPNHVQLAAGNPGEYRGDETKAAAGIEGLIDAGYQVTVTAAAQGTLARLKRAINETGIASFDVIRSQAIDGFIDTAAKTALLTERD